MAQLYPYWAAELPAHSPMAAPHLPLLLGCFGDHQGSSWEMKNALPVVACTYVHLRLERPCGVLQMARPYAAAAQQQPPPAQLLADRRSSSPADQHAGSSSARSPASCARPPPGSPDASRGQPTNGSRSPGPWPGQNECALCAVAKQDAP